MSLPRFLETRTPSYRAHILFVLLLIALLLVLTPHSIRDPTSIFYKPDLAHTPLYSAVRREQAEHFIQEAIYTAQPRVDASRRPDICVGIASVARQDTDYFRTSVGSVLQGLDVAERARMHLVLFIAQTDQSTHPAYHEGWKGNVADTLLSYNVSDARQSEIQQWEEEGGEFRQKSLFDYGYLLRGCEGVGAPYTILLEDDVLALDGWFHRTRQALRGAEMDTRTLGRESFLYLRLFYTERFLGWNTEEWPIYLSASMAVVLLEWLFLTSIRRYFPALTSRAVLISCFIYTPILILLFFAAGRITVLAPRTGIQLMPRYGCCSQGLVFPTPRIPDLLRLFAERGAGMADMIIEDWANARDEVRWAIMPSVLQHIGHKSTKSNGEIDALRGGMRSVATSIWNHGFELNDADVLEHEHRIAVEDSLL